MEYTDTDRTTFLKQLDESTEVEVTDWEAKFIENLMGKTTFTPRQREVIDDMINEYDGRLK